MKKIFEIFKLYVATLILPLLSIFVICILCTNKVNHLTEITGNLTKEPNDESNGIMYTRTTTEFNIRQYHALFKRKDCKQKWIRRCRYSSIYDNDNLKQISFYIDYKNLDKEEVPFFSLHEINKKSSKSWLIFDVFLYYTNNLWCSCIHLMLLMLSFFFWDDTLPKRDTVIRVYHVLPMGISSLYCIFMVYF